MPSYTARELERETGVDRRTIAYYVQEGLLPRVGRRGRRTRYPKLFRDRLLFIRRVRAAEEAGEVSTVSLGDIRKVFERVPPTLIAGVADGRIAITPELVSEPSTAFRTPEMRRGALRERWVGGGRAMQHAPPPRPRGPVSFPARTREEDEDQGEDSADPAGGDRVARQEGPPLDAPEEMAAPRHEPVAESRTPAPLRSPPRSHARDSALVESLQQLAAVARYRNEGSPRSSNTWTRIRITRDLVLSVRGIDKEDAALVERVRRAARKVMGL